MGRTARAPPSDEDGAVVHARDGADGGAVRAHQGQREEETSIAQPAAWASARRPRPVRFSAITAPAPQRTRWAASEKSSEPGGGVRSTLSASMPTVLTPAATMASAVSGAG